MKVILPPHLKAASKVEDPKAIIDEALQIRDGILRKEFTVPGSKWEYCVAMAQPQVSDSPLRYFVVNPDLVHIIEELGGFIIYNPKILEKDQGSSFQHQEGCMSYPFKPPIKIGRFKTIVAEYGIITDVVKPSFTVIKKQLSGMPALILQHELEHMNGRSIWKR